MQLGVAQNIMPKIHKSANGGKGQDTKKKSTADKGGPSTKSKVKKKSRPDGVEVLQFNIGLDVSRDVNEQVMIACAASKQNPSITGAAFCIPYYKLKRSEERENRPIDDAST